MIDEITGLLTLTKAQFAKLPSLFFHIGGRAFELTPNAQIWPVCVQNSTRGLSRVSLICAAYKHQRTLNTFIGGERDAIYLIVNSIGTPTGAGLDFVNGMTFLERFYSVYGKDTDGSQARTSSPMLAPDTTNATIRVLADDVPPPPYG